MSVIPRHDDEVLGRSKRGRFNHYQDYQEYEDEDYGDVYQPSRSHLPPPVTTGAPMTSTPSSEDQVVGVTGTFNGDGGNDGTNGPHDGMGGSLPGVVNNAGHDRHHRRHRVPLHIHHRPHLGLSKRRRRAMGVQISEDEEHYVNPWWKARRRFKVYFAEFLGTLVLVLWGEGTQAQVIALRNAPNDYLSIAWGWGIGFMLAVYISSGISGGHVNPAVTIALTLFRGFPIRKAPGYIFAQLLGAFVAAAMLYGVYYGPLNTAGEGYTASVLTTGPAGPLAGLVSLFFSVFIGAALLMGAIAAFTDTGNNPATPGLTPLLLGLIMVGIASAFGYQTGFVLNPARDLGPRLLVWAVGGSKEQLWVANFHYGIWIPTVGTIAGAIFGIGFYDILIYGGRDSPVNFNFSRRGRRAHSERMQEDRDDYGIREDEETAAGVIPSQGEDGATTVSGSTLREDRSHTAAAEKGMMGRVGNEK